MSKKQFFLISILIMIVMLLFLYQPVKSIRSTSAILEWETVEVDWQVFESTCDLTGVKMDSIQINMNVITIDYHQKHIYYSETKTFNNSFVEFIIEKDHIRVIHGELAPEIPTFETTLE